MIHNFRQPYLSRTITEFWRRWHISLSNWLRDYLYIPIGGNRRGPARTYLNLMITMVLGGLWHGASWTFVVWGALHGLFLAVHRLYRPRPVSSDRLPTLREMPAVLGTFALVCFAWVFFRAASLADAGAVIRGIADLQPGAMPADWLLVVVAAAVLVAIDVLTRLRVPWLWRPSRSPVLVGALTGFGILGLLVFSGTDPVPFVYFQF